MSPNKGKNLLTKVLTNNLNLGCSNATHLNVYNPKPKPAKPKVKAETKLKPEPTPPTTSSSSSDIGDSKTSTTFSPVQDCSDDASPSWPAGNNLKTSTRITYKNKESSTTNGHQDDKRCNSNNSSWKIGDSIAVVKESHDPYVDFRHSMLQMIFEKELFSPEDLRSLLCCFLRLNSPAHHDVILRAFIEVCHVVLSRSSSPPPPSTPVIKP